MATTVTVNNRDFLHTKDVTFHSDFYWTIGIIIALAILAFTVLPMLTVDNHVTPVVNGKAVTTEFSP